jgi:5-methylthioadenosine/S-adenosylhomocysteine deaminase
MAAGQREPVKGYLVVGEDGRLLTVAAGDPPAGLQAKQSLGCGRALGYPRLYLCPQPLMAERLSRVGGGPDPDGMDRCALHARGQSQPGRHVLVHPGWRARPSAAWHHGLITSTSKRGRGRTIPQESLDEFDQNDFRAEMDSGIRFVHGLSVGRATALGVQPSYGVEQARVPLKAFLDWTSKQPKSSNFLRDDQRRHGVQRYLPTDLDGKAAGRRVPSGQ